MSLLLDALQRASKEKAAAGVAAPPANPPAAASFPELAPPTDTPNAPLEFSITPDPEPAPQTSTAAPKAPAPEKIEPTLLSMAAISANTPEPVAAPTIAPPPPPPPPPQPTPPQATAKTKPASREPAALQLSPQVAREILYASAGNQKKPANKRLIAMISFAIVLTLSLGSLFLFQYLNTPSGLATPQLAQTPPPAPAESPATPPGQTSTSTPISAVQADDASPTPAPTEAPTAKPIAADSAAKPAAEPQKTPAAARHKEETPAAPTHSKPLFIAKAAASSPLDAAYAALNEGRLDVAAEAYRRSLRKNPDERDALLGLAYIAHRQGRHDEARTYYQAVLRQEPDHPVANAGLLALASPDSENTASRARDMADKNPESAAAQSALGSTLAREGLIADAQQAFFKAAALEPENPLHAYNLAVALDRLHKHDLAKNYYERALALAEKSSAGSRKDFPREAAVNRLEQLRSRSTINQ